MTTTRTRTRAVYRAALSLPLLAAVLESQSSPQCRARTYGHGNLGSGNYHASISTSGGLPTIGNGAFGLQLQDGLGGAPGCVLTGLTPTNVVYAGSVLWVVPLLSIPGSLGGTGAGAGSARVGLPIPNDLSLHGGQLFFQWGLLDSGLSFSSGLAIEICDPPTSAACRRQLTYGDTVDCVLVPQALAVHTFDASAGDVILVRMVTRGGAFEPQITIHDPTAAPVCSATAPCGSTVAELAACVLPMNGTYTIVARDGPCNGPNAGGPYGLSLQRLDGHPGRALDATFGVNVTTSLTVIGEIDTYSLPVAQGDALFVRMVTGGGAFEPHVEIYDPSGGLLCSRGASCGSTVVEVGTCLPITTAGVHTIVTKDGPCNGADARGVYGLSVHRVGGRPAAALPLPLGVSVTSRTATLGALGALRFVAQADDVVFVRMVTGGGAFEPNVTVFDPVGNSVCSVSAPCGSTVLEIPACQLPTIAGTYLVVAKDGPCNGAGAQGLYTLTVQRPALPENCTNLPIDSSLPGELTLRGELDSFCFRTTTPTATVMISVISGGGAFEPEIVLYGPGGRIAAATATCGSGLVAIPMVAVPAGSYFVLVKDGPCNGADATGSYTISLTCLTGGC